MNVVTDLYQAESAGVGLLEAPLASVQVSAGGVTRPAAASELVMAYFTRCADTIGLPRSLAQLYATLFLSESPLAFEEIVIRSGLSKASASTGLRDLERLHGVERVIVAQDRRSFYQAQLSLRRLIGAFVAETVKPGLHDGDRLLREALVLATEGDHSEHFEARLNSLVTWHERASEILPILSALAAPSHDD
jgi:DNA-binding transcriptional regulator GbsR (MarR family)